MCIRIYEAKLHDSESINGCLSDSKKSYMKILMVCENIKRISGYQEAVRVSKEIVRVSRSCEDVKRDWEGIMRL